MQYQTQKNAIYIVFFMAYNEGIRGEEKTALKKDLLQIITIVLCVVLIIMVSAQDKKIDELTQQLNTKMESTMKKN